MKRLALMLFCLFFMLQLFSIHEVEPNNTWDATGVQLVGNGDMTGSITQNDMDYWKIWAESGDDLWINCVNNQTTFDSYLYLFDSTGSTELAFNDDAYAGTTQSRIEYTVQNSDWYYIKIQGFHSGTQGDYLLELTGSTGLGGVAPGVPNSPIPNDGVIGVTHSNCILSWQWGSNTETYDIYFGMDSLPETPIVSDAVADTLVGNTFNPGILALDSQYIWKVVAKNTNSIYEISAEWSFHTEVGQSTIQIGNGTSVEQSLPIDPLSDFSYTQTLYYQSEINIPNQRVERLYYHHNGFSNLIHSNNWVVYMGHTTQTAFETNDDWVPFDQLTEVFNGNISLSENGWIELVLQTPFEYNNTDNLVIAIDENDPLSSQDGEEFYCEDTSSYRSIHYVNDQFNPDPTSPWVGIRSTYIPETRLQFDTIPTSPEVYINRDSFDFGTRLCNTSSVMETISVSNSGIGVLSVNSVTMNDPNNFTLVDDNAYPVLLNANESIQLGIHFNPVDEGVIDGEITITDDLRQTHTIVLTGEGFGGVIHTFPFNEDFENNGLIPVGWQYGDEDDRNWQFGQETDTSNTGPSADHTSGDGYFMYTESSYNFNLRFDVITPEIDLTNLDNPYCSLYYCLNGATMGTLHFDIWDGTQWNLDVTPSLSGNSGDNWLQLEFPISGYSDMIQLRFRGINGSSYYSDMAIDDVSFFNNVLPPDAPTLISPANNAIDVATTGQLVWNATPGATGYLLNMASVNPHQVLYDEMDLGDTNVFDYTNLTPGLTHFWQVLPYNESGVAENCPAWSFTTTTQTPGHAINIYPLNGSSLIHEIPKLQWESSGIAADGYRLYMGTDNPPSNFIDGLDLGYVEEYQISNPLSFSSTYYWKIVPYNSVGDANNCNVWSFSTNSNNSYGGDGSLYGGYYFANNISSGNGLGFQPTYHWVDITSSGQVPQYSDLDDGFVTVDIGFDFNFFGNDYSQVSLNTNGLMMFSNPSGTLASNMTIPSTSSPNDCIAMFAQDLHTGLIPSTARFGHDEVGNFVYSVQAWCSYGDPNEYIDVQAILYESGRIKLQYNNLENPNNEFGDDSLIGDACIGIENIDGTIGHQYSLDGVGGPVCNGVALAYATTPEELAEPIYGLIVYDAYDFDVVPNNTTSAPYNLRIRNLNPNSITITNPISITGDDADQFSLTDNNIYPLVIPSGTDAFVEVYFEPVTEGHKFSEVVFHDDFVESREQHAVQLHGYSSVIDSNDIPANALVIQPDIEGLDAIIEPETDIDWYVFWQSAPTSLSIHTENTNDSSINLDAYLYGPYPPHEHPIDLINFTAYNDSSWVDNQNPLIDIDLDNSGYYFLRIANRNNQPETNTSLSSRHSATTTFNRQSHRWNTGDYQLFVSTTNNGEEPGFLPPDDLGTEIDFQGITLVWDEPIDSFSHLSGYNVYRDDQVINQNPITDIYYLDSSDNLNAEQDYVYKVTALYDDPLFESEFSDSVTVTFEDIAPPILWEDFEGYQDFSSDLGYWTTIDVDGGNTITFDNGIDFLGEGDPMSFITFNPSSTTPPLQFAEAYSGDKYATCITNNEIQNDDWLISPQIEVSSDFVSIEFMIKSYTTVFGAESYDVAISDGSADPNDFISLTGGNPVNAPTSWTSYSYDIYGYMNEFIRVGFHCVSNQTYMLMIDDIKINNVGGTVELENQLNMPEKTVLRGNYPNPFNPTTSISFDLQKNADVTIDVYNVLGQRVSRVVKANFNAGRHSVVWNGNDESGQSVASGVYFYRMTSGDYSQTKKMMLMK